MKEALLALLANAPAHGYELKLALESTFGAAWPPTNIGQIYTTLGRLERDGFVTCDVVTQNGRPDKKTYAITEAGRAELVRWLNQQEQSPRLRDDLFMRIILARSIVSEDDASAIISRQRAAFLKTIREYEQLLLEQSTASPGAALLIEAALLHLEADLRWLDLCESAIATATKEIGR
jgi:DNA-binding PadR family transcriptional regulator